MWYKQQFTYVGIDETTLGIGPDSSIVVAAVSTDPALAKDYSDYPLKKAKDYLRMCKIDFSDTLNLDFLPEFPSIDSMKKIGLEDYHWMRAKGGRFTNRMLQHATISHIISSNGYVPEKTVILIDAFHGNIDQSKYIIYELLQHKDFDIPRENIEIIFSADKSIPLVNMADLMAFQIGLWLNERYRDYFPDRVILPIKPFEIEYDEKRMTNPLSCFDRETLEEIIHRW